MNAKNSWSETDTKKDAMRKSPNAHDFTPEITKRTGGTPLTARIPERVVDPIPSMSDGERIDKYAYTGDPRYLTPHIAREMEVSPETMHRVVGATEEDFAYAKEISSRNEIFENDYYVGLRKKYSFGVEDMAGLSRKETIQKLFDIASFRKKTLHEDEIDEVKEIAFLEIYENVSLHSATVLELFNAIRHTEFQGLQDLEIIEEVYRKARTDFIELSHKHGTTEEENRIGEIAAGTLNQFVEVAQATMESEGIESSTNYLLFKRIESFAYRVGVTETAEHEMGYIPFEITRGILATFSEDGDRLYVVNDKKWSRHFIERLSHVGKPEFYEQGIYSARHTAVDIPQDITDLHCEVMDAGTPIESVLDTTTNISPELLHEYLKTLRTDVRVIIEEDFSVTLSDLSIREQIALISFLKGVPVKDAKEVQKFTSKYGVLGIQAFLTLEQLGPDYGWEIVNRAMAASITGRENTVKKIFTEVVEMEKMSLDAEKYLSKNFGSKETQAIHQVINDIRIRSADLLKTLLAKSLETPEDERLLAENIEKGSQNNVLFISAFKTLKLRGELRLDEIRDTSFESLTSATLTEEDKERMLKILKQSWKAQGTEFVDSVSESLESALRSTGTRFYVLRHKGVIVGFNRFDDKSFEKEPHLYFGSFNTDASYGNGKLGEVLYEESLAAEVSKNIPIRANCNPLSPITQKYIESGFVATSLEDYAGVPSFSITLDTEKNQSFKSKTWTTEQVVRAVLHQNTENVLAFSVSRTEEIPFEKVNKGYVLTRYFKQGSRFYVVFEKGVA